MAIPETSVHMAIREEEAPTVLSTGDTVEGNNNANQIKSWTRGRGRCSLHLVPHRSAAPQNWAIIIQSIT